MSIFVDQARIVLPDARIATSGIRFENGTVAAIGADARQAGDTVVDGQGRLLTPGLIDMHVHGIMQYCFGNGADDLLAAAGCFARFGTTTVLPTVVPKRGGRMLHLLADLAAALDRVDGVHMPGFHLEGPFTALPGAGCDVVPGDLGLLEELLAACKRRVRVVSLSPDTPNVLPIIERLCEHGIVPFVTHTRATLQQARAAIAAGARHATHFYDVFPIPEESEPGVRPAGAVEAYLADPGTTVDFIADGCHVDPVVIQLAVHAKTLANVAVITDANIGAGLPPGEYETPLGYRVDVRPGRGARIADAKHPIFGVLAGSALTMNEAMSNVLRWLDAPPDQIWALGTANPARIAGLKSKGSLTVGKDADAVLWNEDWTPAMVWVGGVKRDVGGAAESAQP